MMKQIEPIVNQFIFWRKEKKKKLSQKFWGLKKSFYLCTRF